MVVKKHAFLIEAHNNKEQLEQLFKCLDYPDNDIFLHIDSKSNCLQGIEDYSFKYSKLYIINSIKVFWGGYSQIQVEMSLLEEAVKKGGYCRYHLISGADLPLVTQKEMHTYFDTRDDVEFVHFDYVNSYVTFKNRMAQYHFLRDHIDRTQSFFCFVEKASIIFQRAIGINRIKKLNVELYKGANWFSITDECARYVVEKKVWIQKVFRNTKCCDEVFLQTLVYNSEFKNKRFFDERENRCGNMRLTDWKRGNPYIFKNDDFNQLVTSNYMFARKFDQEVDREIINRIVEYVTRDN